MGTTIIQSGYSATNPTRFANPVQNDLLYSGVFNSRTSGFWERNFAPSGVAGAVVGVPTLADSGATVQFTGLTNYIQTTVQETDELTVLMVAATDDALVDVASRPCFFGTYTSPAANAPTDPDVYGVHSRVSAAGAIRMGAGRGTSWSDDTAGDAAVVVADHTALAIYTMTAQSGVVTSMTDHTNGNTAVDDSTADRLLTAATYRVGSGYKQYGGTCRIGQLRIWGAVKSDAAIAEEVRFTRWSMAQLGVSSL